MLVAWQGGGKREVAVPEEFSVGGVFLIAPQPLGVGTIVELLFDVPGGEVRVRGANSFTRHDGRKTRICLSDLIRF